jgi:hypothetical protein
MLPAARKAGNCPRIDSAQVACITSPNGEQRERWTFSMCGKSVSMVALYGPRPGGNAKATSDHAAEGRTISVMTAHQFERQATLVGCKKLVPRELEPGEGPSYGLSAMKCADGN